MDRKNRNTEGRYELKKISEEKKTIMEWNIVLIAIQLK